MTKTPSFLKDFKKNLESGRELQRQQIEKPSEESPTFVERIVGIYHKITDRLNDYYQQKPIETSETQYQTLNEQTAHRSIETYILKPHETVMPEHTTLTQEKEFHPFTAAGTTPHSNDTASKDEDLADICDSIQQGMLLASGEKTITPKNTGNNTDTYRKNNRAETGVPTPSMENKEHIAGEDFGLSEIFEKSPKKPEEVIEIDLDSIPPYQPPKLDTPSSLSHGQKKKSNSRLDKISDAAYLISSQLRSGKEKIGGLFRESPQNIRITASVGILTGMISIAALYNQTNANYRPSSNEILAPSINLSASDEDKKIEENTDKLLYEKHMAKTLVEVEKRVLNKKINDIKAQLRNNVRSLAPLTPPATTYMPKEGETYLDIYANFEKGPINEEVFKAFLEMNNQPSVLGAGSVEPKKGKPINITLMKVEDIKEYESIYYDFENNYDSLKELKEKLTDLEGKNLTLEDKITTKPIGDIKKKNSLSYHHNSEENQERIYSEFHPTAPSKPTNIMKGQYARSVNSVFDSYISNAPTTFNMITYEKARSILSGEDGNRLWIDRVLAIENMLPELDYGTRTAVYELISSNRSFKKHLDQGKEDFVRVNNHLVR